jgi:hypothetical protein
LKNKEDYKKACVREIRPKIMPRCHHGHWMLLLAIFATALLSTSCSASPSRRQSQQQQQAMIQVFILFFSSAGSS